MTVLNQNCLIFVQISMSVRIVRVTGASSAPTPTDLSTADRAPAPQAISTGTGSVMVRI